MKFSILINCHNQSKFIDDCILSCMNQKYHNFEVIVIDSSTKKLNYKKFRIGNKLKYFHISSNSKYPEMNQMNKVLFGLKKAAGDYICLLDADDKFSDQKLKNLFRFLNKYKVKLVQDVPLIFENKNKFNKLIIKKLKKNILFRKILIPWPQIFGTSSITIKASLLKEFFIKANPFKWTLLAIDVQLIIFCKLNYNISEGLENITFKRKHGSNLGDKYLNIFSKIFWKRRLCQHKFYFFLKKKKDYSLDYFVTFLVNKFL